MTFNRVLFERGAQEHPDLAPFVLAFLHEKGMRTGMPVFAPLKGDGSKRTFWRVLTDLPDHSFIAMANPPVDESSTAENRAYLRIGEHLRRKGIPLPEMHRYDLEKGWFLMEDFGDVSLQEYLVNANDPMPVLKKVLLTLIDLQMKGVEGFRSDWCCQTERYNRQVMLRYEADYFTTAFLHGYLHLKKDWPELGSSFAYLAEIASRAESSFFLHRDFQSRNILLFQGEPRIIDWQGGRFGPLGYDLASLIIDPYTSLSSETREEMRCEYLRLLGERRPDLTESFLETFYPLAIFRNLQILGAFSFLSRIMKKTYFEAYIPPALKSLRELIGHIPDGSISPLKDLLLGRG